MNEDFMKKERTRSKWIELDLRHAEFCYWLILTLINTKERAKEFVLSSDDLKIASCCSIIVEYEIGNK